MSISFISLSPPLATTTITSLPASFGLSTPQKQCFTRKFSCKASSDERNSEDKTSNANNKSRFDRRDILLGLGGLYGVGGLTSATPFASASPIIAPILKNCHTPEDLDPGVTAVCCPPIKSTVTDYVVPKGKLKIRPAAQNLDKEYIAKYEKAMKMMRDLKDTDPRSFSQQAKIHCAYCNGAYEMVGFEDQYIQVHNCWLFFPFHRWYLYFYERILGNLIGDPNFALPFWNWDAPVGYPIPSIFNDPNSSLFDPIRNQSHLPPVPVDLDYDIAEVGTVSTTSIADQTDVNLKVMYRQMVSASTTKRLFFGEPYRSGGTPDPGAGSIENTPHSPIHIWCGDTRQKNLENMGNFYSAGRDPVFYSHHSNVDRMWNLWKTIPVKNSSKRQDITDPDYLNATFLFYDENANLVRVKVADCLDSGKQLGYVYDQVDIPWLKTKPTPLNKPKPNVKKVLQGIIKPARAAEKNLVKLSDFPLTLDKTVSVLVPRPKTRRTEKEKEKEEEVLVIQGIEFDKSLAVKFNVYINDEDDNAPSRANSTEFAGSFVNVPHSSNGVIVKTVQRFGITELLEDLGSEDDENVVVTFVPKVAIGKVSIDGIKIELED